MFQLNPIAIGQFFTIRRDILGSSDGWYNIRQLKLYQTPNLLQVSGITVLITSNTTSAISSFEPLNLLQNLEHRSSGKNLFALIASTDPATTLGQHTCYKVPYAQIIGGKIIISIEFSEQLFMHAITHAQDQLLGDSFY